MLLNVTLVEIKASEKDNQISREEATWQRK